MKRFLNERLDELTIGQSLVYSLVITTVCFAPFAVWAFEAWVKEKIDERRNK